MEAITFCLFSSIDTNILRKVANIHSRLLRAQWAA